MPRLRVPEQDTPQLYSHKDLRSRCRAHNRLRKQSQKYYGYRGVHPSWIDQTYLDCTVNTIRRGGHVGENIDKHPFTTMLAVPQVHMVRSEFKTSEDPVQLPSEICGRKCTVTTRPAIWTRKDAFNERENNIYPLDRRHHFSTRKYTLYGARYDVKHRGQGMKQKHRNLDCHIENCFEPFNIADRWESTLNSILGDYLGWNEEYSDLDYDLSFDEELEPFTDAQGQVAWCTQSDFLRGNYQMGIDEADPSNGSEFEDSFSDVASWIFLCDACQPRQEEDFDMLSDVEFDVLSLSSISSNDDDLLP